MVCCRPFFKKMILTKNSIVARLESGQIKIAPFHERFLTPNGYDLHLGQNLFMLSKSGAGYLDPKQDCAPYFQSVATNDEGAFELWPGKLYLGVSVEYTESLDTIPQMEGKSSLGRLGIESHVCAGFGDIGFCGHWTLEIRVTVPTLLWPGMPIGQLVFHEPTDEGGETYAMLGSYNNSAQESPMPVFPNLHSKPHQFLEI